MSCCKENNQLLLGQLWWSRKCLHRSCAIASRPRLGDTPLRSLLEADFGVPVSVDNDANVAALGSIALALDRI